MDNNVKMLETTIKNLKAQTEALERQLAFERRMMGFGYKKGKLGGKVYWFNSKGVPIFTESGEEAEAISPAEEPETVMPGRIVRLCESVFDIALMAQHLCEQKRVKCDDSRELFATVLSLAEEFEAKYPDEEYGDAGEDYLDVIEKYAEGNLMGKYGIE